MVPTDPLVVMKVMRDHIWQTSGKIGTTSEVVTDFAMLLGKNSDEFETFSATEFPEKVQELLEEIVHINDERQNLVHELQDVKTQIRKLFEILCMGQRLHNRKDDHAVRPRDLKVQIELIFNAVEDMLAEANQMASEQKVPYTPPY